MLTLSELVSATGGRLEGADLADYVFPAVSTDTRAISPGCLFVCLVGERFDGHAFMATAVADGAVAIVAQEGHAGPLPAVPVLWVADTQRALGDIARAWRRKSGVKVVAVTGSSGKTSTKEMVAAYLSQHFCVLKTEANFNNEIGVPLTLLRLRPEHQVAVVEMGMRAKGEIAYLTEVAEPDVGIVTNIGTAHIGRLGSQAAIAEAKSELWRHMPPSGIAIVPKDDPLALGAAEAWGGPSISFSNTDVEATVWAHDVHPQGDGQVFTAYWKPAGPTPEAIGHGRSEVAIPLWGDHHRANALAALATGLALGVRPQPRLKIVPEQLPGRSVTLQAGGVTLLDDTYNANPDSMKAALKAFAEAPAKGRRFAVLGDMGELGESAPAAHRGVGAFASELALDGLVAVGTLAAAYAERFVTARHFEEGEAACAYLAEIVRPGDRILFKASRAAKLETLVHCLKDRLEA